MPDVDEHKHIDQLFSHENIRTDHLLQLLLHHLGTFGKAIARKVNQIPLVVDDEMVDEQSLARCSGGFGQPLVVAKHIDKARFAHIASANKSILGLVVLGAHLHGWTAYRKF